MRGFAYLITAVFFMLVMHACERDDLCAASIPKSPRLIFRFTDAANPGQFLSPAGLKVLYPEVNDSLPAGTGTFTQDSLGIPIPTGSGEINTLLVLVENANDTLLRNPDTLNFRYLAQEVFVSKACGFKNDFILQSVSLRADGNNWIQNITIINDTIQNEFEAAVRIAH